MDRNVDQSVVEGLLHLGTQLGLKTSILGDARQERGREYVEVVFSRLLLL